MSKEKYTMISASRSMQLLAMIASLIQYGLTEAVDSDSRIELGRRDLADTLYSNKQKVIYPDYCWFVGLENRILLEYPDLEDLLTRHKNELNQKNLEEASELHKALFQEIYFTELERIEENFKADEEQDIEVDVVLYDKFKRRAAYKLFDLWANTPGNFESRKDDYKNYLESHLIQSHNEFWSYCSYQPEGCDKILGQLISLSQYRDLGPIELLQLSINIITLMNSYKADLLLEDLTKKGIIDLSELVKDEKLSCELEQRTRDGAAKGSHQDELLQEDNVDHRIAGSITYENKGDLDPTIDDGYAYDRGIEKVVKLIETDDDFNEAVYNFVLMSNKDVQEIIGPKIEPYFADRIRKARPLGCTKALSR